MNIAQDKIARLKTEFDRIEQTHVRQNQIQNDPLSRVLRYPKAADREVVALIAAVFAYGNVKQILRSVDRVLDLLGDSPAAKLKSSDGNFWKKSVPRNFKHRFNTSYDLGILLTWIGEGLRRSDTLESFMIEGAASLSSDGLLENFVTKLIALPCPPYKAPKSKGALFFFPRPSNKSSCKRLLLFLRWMAGSGPMALDQWKRVEKTQLVIPVDTHVLRISQNLGFTKRKDASWKTAVEITQALKKVTPQDPTRYDFALCHLGISQACPSRFKIAVCQACQMKTLCKNFSKS